MTGGNRLVSPVDVGRCISVLGGLYVVLAISLAIRFLAANAAPIEVAGRLALVGTPGLVIIYAGYRIPRMGLHRAESSRIIGWTVGGFGIMLTVLGAMELISPTGVDRPVFSTLLTTALGSMGGVGAGIYDARARTREHELRETVAQLRAANERLEQFTYAASHDLQEPLRMVSSYLRLLESRYGDELDDDAREFIDFAVDGADRMRAMVDSLREYSGVISRGEPPEPTDAGVVLEEARDNLRLQIDGTNATITADELPTVIADRDQLAAVFQNLLSNALVYSGDDPPRVHVSAERIDDMYRFSVADEGVGIDPAYHDRIFRPFERLQADDERGERTGEGFGLALCKRIVEHHGGDIWVESTPGDGATFYFTLPGPERPRADSNARVPGADR